MIRFLKGHIHSKDERTIILLVNGVGYHVFVPGNILAYDLEELELYIHTHVREDAFTLYGFRTKNELNFFELLLSINGIGPKMAMEIVNEPVEKIQAAIFGANLPYLTRIPGVGKKIAERMVLELKGKLGALPTETPGLKSITEPNEDVVTALENLGYKRHHIQTILSQVKGEMEAEALIRYFLQRA